MSDFQQRIAALQKANAIDCLAAMRRGIEKESLRITPKGELSQQPHPDGLGAALTHPYITTDFSEALLEFITPAFDKIDTTLAFLKDTHRYTYKVLSEQEMLWVNSMPCMVGQDSDIPLAYYGTSNIGRMKYVYREGLGHRYGRAMQTIAGVHYNLSFPETFFEQLRLLQSPKATPNDSAEAKQHFIDEQYFSLIRNFQRLQSLVIYLIGASPAVCGSFFQGRQHKLSEAAPHSFSTPHATSLRLGDLGYQNDAQADLSICYNSLPTYITTLLKAMRTTHPAYQKLGVKDNGHWKQLSDHILQIENEYYASIRPKRTAESGERPTCALSRRGVEYIEIRNVDLNPFDPIGIDRHTAHFLEALLFYCLLLESPTIAAEEQQRIRAFSQIVVYEGRDPDLRLPGSQQRFHDWALKHFDGIVQCARLLDQAYGYEHYQEACEQQMEKIEDPSLTPSAQIMQVLQEQQKPFFTYAMQKAEQHQRYFSDMTEDEQRTLLYQQWASASHSKQRALEAEDTISFEAFVEQYYSKNPC